MPWGPQKSPGSWLRSSPQRARTFPWRSRTLTRSPQFGHVDDVVAVDEYLARLEEAGPNRQVSAVQCEYLEAVVLAVGHVQPVLVFPDAMHKLELARAVARLAPGGEKLPVLGELVDAAVAIAIGDVHIALRRQGEVPWGDEREDRHRGRCGYRPV